MRLLHRSALAAPLFCAFACGGQTLAPTPSSDAGVVLPAHDAAPMEPSDAGFTDSGTVADSGVHADAGPPPPVDAGPPPPVDAGEPDPDAGQPQTLAEQCFSDIFDPAAPGPDYDQFSPTAGSHCLGTNHQAITGVQRVVFLGDSVTVGSPPTLPQDFYRSRLSDMLTAQFNLQAPSDTWKRASYTNGTSLIRESGDFASCAKWGARADDLMRDNTQVQDCLPEDKRDLRTLVILTIGGNDIASITKNGTPSGGRTLAEVTAQTAGFIALVNDTIAWIKAPGRFPNGVDVVLANMFEFTDGTGDVDSCPAAGLAGFDEPWTNPQDLEDLVVWANEEFMRITVDHGADMIFMLENFCGHGFYHDDPTNRCYRGPMAERWFDATCIHPNPTGHGVIADMFMAVVNE